MEARILYSCNIAFAINERQLDKVSTLLVPVTVLVEMHDARPENPDYVTHLTHWPTEAQISAPGLDSRSQDRGPSRPARTVQ